MLALPNEAVQAEATRAGLGIRVGVRRRQQGLSRRVVANLVGRSEEWLRQVERGQRRLDSIEVFVHLARVLHIEDLSEFLGWRDEETTASTVKTSLSGPLTARLRDVLMQPLFLASDAVTPQPSVPRLCHELDHLLAMWRDSARRHTQVASLLPSLLRQLRSAWQQGDWEPELASALVQAYGLSCTFADRMNDRHLAWMAADQCLDVAVSSGDPVQWGAASVHRSACMRAMGYLPQAHQFALDCAQRLDTEREQPVKGALLLQAAEAAAAENRQGEAVNLIDQARLLAGRMNKDETAASIYFGPTEVAIREVRIALRLGRVDKALRLARNVSLPADVPIEPHVRYLVTTAFAYMRARDDVAAVFALNRVAALSPDDLKFDQLARQTIIGLTKRSHDLIAEDVSRLRTEAGL
jgi:transcriptional regulator with XRE-family HTH domain